MSTVDNTPLPRPVFQDAHDPPRTWTFRITLAHVRDIQALYPDFRLERILAPQADESIRISNDVVLLADVLQVLLIDQLQHRGMTILDLINDCQGHTVNGIYIALVSAVANFCQSRVAREQARRILNVYHALLKLESQVSETMSCGNSSGPTPPVPELFPGATHSANSVSTELPPPGGEPPWPESTSMPSPEQSLPPLPATLTT